MCWAVDAFHSGLLDFDNYLLNLQSQPDAFSATRLLTLIDNFAPALYKHLANEIVVMLSLATYEPKIPVMQLWKTPPKVRTNKWAKLNNELFFLFNHDVTFEEPLWTNFPPFPAYLRMGLVYGLSWWNWGWWKFASCGNDGRPKKLYATGGLCGE